MGDHGQTYATFTPSMCRRMKDLVSMGDIVTPNLTEACILTGRPFRKKGWNREELKTMAADIQAMGPESVVITGVNQGGYLVNVVAEGRREDVYKRQVPYPEPSGGHQGIKRRICL